MLVTHGDEERRHTRVSPFRARESMRNNPCPTNTRENGCSFSFFTKMSKCHQKTKYQSQFKSFISYQIWKRWENGIEQWDSYEMVHLKSVTDFWATFRPHSEGFRLGEKWHHISKKLQNVQSFWNWQMCTSRARLQKPWHCQPTTFPQGKSLTFESNHMTHIMSTSVWQSPLLRWAA